MSKTNSQTISDFYNSNTILINISIAIVLYYVMLYLSILIKNRPQYSWWNNNNGKTYDKFINIDSLILSQDSLILYKLACLFGNEFNCLSSEEISFITSSLLPHARMPSGVPGNFYGFMLPRHLCRDIKFIKGENVEFDTWALNTGKDIEKTLTYNGDSPSNNGVYPSFQDFVGWKSKMMEWGIKKWKINKGNITTPELDGDQIKEWYNTKTHPDNILALYGIGPDSPLILGFVNNAYNDANNGIIFSSDAMKKLLGENNNYTSSAGGWIGFLRAIDPKKAMDFMFTKYFVSQTTAKNDKDNDPNSPGKCGPRGISSSIVESAGSGLATGVMFAKEGLTLGGPYAWGIGLTIGLGSFFASPTMGACYQGKTSMNS